MSEQVRNENYLEILPGLNSQNTLVFIALYHYYLENKDGANYLQLHDYVKSREEFQLSFIGQSSIVRALSMLLQDKLIYAIKTQYQGNSTTMRKPTRKGIRLHYYKCRLCRIE